MKQSIIFRRTLTTAFLLLGWCALPAFAAGTQFWTSGTFEDFSRGNLSGVSLTREGTITLAPKLEEVFHTDQAMVWAVARDQRGSIYLGTGHSGKVFRLGPDWKGELFFDAQEPDVFALAVDKNNRLYVGTSPDGKIYRLDSAGNASEFFAPKTKYIWAMAFAPDGSLYVGTGDRGRIYRVAPDGAGEVFYETNQSHIMSLALTPAGDLIAGSEPNGLLYKISSAGKAFVLYDAPLAEIHQVSVGSDGSVYAAALGAGDARRLRQGPAEPSPGPLPVTPMTTITVRASDDPTQLPGPGGPEGQPEQPPPEGGAAAPAQIAPGARFPLLGGRAQPGGQSRSAIVRIWPDSTVETLWSSSSENAFDLLPSDSQLLFSTDEKGHIYQLLPSRELALLTQTDQEQTTRLIPIGNAILVTTANLGKVFRLGSQPVETGSLESEVRDAGNTAGWGQIRWKSELPAGTSLELHTRSGNSNRPDATWSEWSTPYRNGEGEPIASPAARYMQWKAVFHSVGGRSPALREVTLAYLPRNRAPEISEIKAVPRAERSPAVNPAGGGAAAALGANQTGARSFSGVATANRSNAPRSVDVTWLATDPDQDELTYTLYFRGEGEAEWKMLQENLKQNYFQLNPEALPDGDYRLKVVASDAGQNAAATAKTADRISAPFIVDHTPPQVEVQGVNRTGMTATVRFRAADNASVLTRAEYAVDAQPLQPSVSDDGIVDSREEAFTIQLGSLDSQEHLLTLRVYDSTGNVGIGKAVLPALPGPGGGPAIRLGRTP